MPLIKDTLDTLTTPSTLFLLLACIALIALLLRWRRTAITSLSVSLTGFLVFGGTSISHLLIAPLETRFAPVDLEQAPPPFGIIVLGAGLSERHANHYGSLMELEEGGEAVPTAALLAMRYPEARIILTGGNGTNDPAAPLRGTDGMRRILLAFGVDGGRIMIDPDAPTTAARAQNTLALVGADRDEVWWVITPSHRMPRLIGTYRRLGFDPIPYPVDFKWFPPFEPLSTQHFVSGLQLTDTAVHEWRGLAFYYFTGKLDTLFPGPD
ncbi:YdcF family protein [Loktanella sp. Alg231-35]|uniref:YdcF family protein n=1 Tax=Loktanella sp. Alg231-35 TaxID=1922220 RepID=UPI000D54E60F|nr:YdcF family protein [Loktanella sp. Alg231-35]